MNTNSSLRFIAEALIPGETRNDISCPFCGGGLRKDRSFVITKKNNGVVLFICHRAQCGKTGKVWTGWGEYRENVDPAPVRPDFVPRPYTRPVGPLSQAALDVFMSKYQIGPEDLSAHGVQEERGTERVVIPIRWFDGEVTGVESRAYTQAYGDILPKTLHYRENPKPWVGVFYGPDGPSTRKTVLVEDVISAIKVSRQYTAISLMGTHLSSDTLLAILGFIDNPCLCLDRDATDKALGLKRKFQFLCPEMEVRPLQQDLKYESDEQIKRIIENE